MRQLATAPLLSRSLLAHGLPANTVLAGLANARFLSRDCFTADHAFFGRLGHYFRLSQINKLSILSVDDLDLFRILDHDLQPILRMIFDRSDYFHVSIFEVPGRLLVLLEKFHGRTKDDGSESFSRGTEI
jgi:hypothetical protein